MQVCWLQNLARICHGGLGAGAVMRIADDRTASSHLRAASTRFSMPVNWEKTTALPPPAFWWLCSAYTRIGSSETASLLPILTRSYHAHVGRMLQCT